MGSYGNTMMEDLSGLMKVYFSHVSQIKHALGIDGVITSESSWIIPGKGLASGAQIDLLINRDDRFISMCEMKFTSSEFEVKKDYSIRLLERMDTVQQKIGAKKSIQSVLVTTFGLKRNEYASRFDKVVSLKDLFQK